jgi:hypothetical protein
VSRIDIYQKSVFIDTTETDMDRFENIPYENYERSALKFIG